MVILKGHPTYSIPERTVGTVAGKSERVNPDHDAMDTVSTGRRRELSRVSPSIMSRK